MKIKFKDYKKILFYLLVPLLFGGLVGILNSDNFSNYDGLVSSWLFPVIWSILYILMGFSSYLISDNKRLFNIYKVNLMVNLLWTFIFFMFNLKVFAFFWILLLSVIVGFMIYEFYKENKFAAYLLIPYFLWLIFASILNLLQII